MKTFKTKQENKKVNPFRKTITTILINHHHFCLSLPACLVFKDAFKSISIIFIFMASSQLQLRTKYPLNFNV